MHNKCNISRHHRVHKCFYFCLPWIYLQQRQAAYISLSAYVHRNIASILIYSIIFSLFISFTSLVFLFFPLQFVIDEHKKNKQTNQIVLPNQSKPCHTNWNTTDNLTVIRHHLLYENESLYPFLIFVFVRFFFLISEPPAFIKTLLLCWILLPLSCWYCFWSWSTSLIRPVRTFIVYGYEINSLTY